MAMSALERKRNQIERRREQERLLPDSTYSFLKEPFYAWLNRTKAGGDWEAAMFHLDAAALPRPEFVDDRGPYSINGEVERLKDDSYAGFEKSIGRAESMVDNLLSAASGMAMVINRYKQEELKERIAEIEQSNLSDSVRVSLYQWKIKGE
jgi:hypothetical protein